jgi:ribosomal protein L20A (L18A)
MSKLFKVCLDIKGNDKGLAVTTVAADSEEEAIEKAKKHVGAMNQNVKPRAVAVKGCKEVGKRGCITDHYIPRQWV